MGKDLVKHQLRNIGVTAGLLLLATGLAFILFFFISKSPANITLFYFIGVLSIARQTDGYFYGIFASFCSIIFINYFFSYPYFDINFLLPTYPFTFSCMLTLSLATSASVSYIKKQNRALRLRERQLAEAEKERMRENILRSISHDLRTPLTGILGSASSIAGDLESPVSPEQQKLLSHIQDDAGWLLHLVENLLSIMRIAGDGTRLETVPELVEEVIDEAVMRLHKQMPEARIDISVPEAALLVPMDAMLIEQVLINLLASAVAHDPDGHSAHLTVEERAKDVAFHITDDGVGPDNVRLFQIFNGVSSDSSAADSQKGIGTGFSVCHTIINAHKGRIVAQNYANGAEFMFTLPKEASA